MSSEIYIYFDFEQMKSEVEKLRTELSMLVLERDELRFVECKNIEMKYMLELGALEYKAFEAKCIFLRLRRKVDLIQAKKNRQEVIDLAAIDEILDIEFAEFQQKLDEQINKMNKAIERSKGEFLTEKETAELKKLYRRIVKALHPDLHPDFGDEKITLFNQAVSAYENGDLNTLRIIDEMVSDSVLPETHEDAFQALAKEKERLNGLIEFIKESIQSIRSSYPYILKEIISDGEKTAERKKLLNEIIEEYRRAIEVYKVRIKEMAG